MVVIFYHAGRQPVAKKHSFVMYAVSNYDRINIIHTIPEGRINYFVRRTQTGPQGESQRQRPLIRNV